MARRRDKAERGTVKSKDGIHKRLRGEKNLFKVLAKILLSALLASVGF